MLDSEMREPLFDYLEEYFGKIRFIEEKVIMKSRADVLGVIDGAIVGFEIKSDSDTYQRLETQIPDYDKYCDYAYLVIGKKHKKHAEEHIPDHWGLICINDAENIEMCREAGLSPKVKLINQLGFLWRNELGELLSVNHLPKCTNKNKKEISKLLIDTIDNDLLREQFTERLFERDYSIFDEKNREQEEKGVSTGFRKTKTGIKAKRRVKKPPRPVGIKHVITGSRNRKKRSGNKTG